MVKLDMRIDENDYNIRGYNLQYKTFGWQECFIKVKNVMSLYQAIMIVENKYSDKNKYRIDPEESYMLLEEIEFKLHN
jgi:hypothetical protein